MFSIVMLINWEWLFLELSSKTKRGFEGSLKTKGLRSKRRNSPYIFQVVASLPTKACSV